MTTTPRRGKWPTFLAGPIPGSGETWAAINHALQHGGRGLPSEFSLAQFLARHRGMRNPARLPELSESQILAWADAYFQQHGAHERTRPGGRRPWRN